MIHWFYDCLFQWVLMQLEKQLYCTSSSWEKLWLPFQQLVNDLQTLLIHTCACSIVRGHVCMYTRNTHTHVHLQMHMIWCAHTHTHTHTHIHKHTLTLFLSLTLSLSLSLSHTHTQTRTHTHTHADSHTHTHRHTHKQTHTHTHTLSLSLSHTHTHAHVYTCTHSLLVPHTHVMSMCNHTRARAHTHTQIFKRGWGCSCIELSKSWDMLMSHICSLPQWSSAFLCLFCDKKRQPEWFCCTVVPCTSLDLTKFNINH